MSSLKKLLVVGLIVAGVGFAALNPWARSHIALLWDQLCGAVQESITPEQELARLRKELDGLKSEDERLIDKLAKQGQKAEKLEAKIGKQREALAKKKADLVVLHKALEPSGEQVSLPWGQFTRQQVEKDLNDDFTAFESAAEELKANEEFLAELKKSIQAGHEHRRKLRVLRQEMATELQRLETALEKERLADADEEGQNTEGHQRVKTGIEALKDRIAVMNKSRKLRNEPEESPIKQAKQKFEQDEARKARIKAVLGSPDQKVAKGN